MPVAMTLSATELLAVRLTPTARRAAARLLHPGSFEGDRQLNPSLLLV